jgi:flagellar L-ring protein precursor FlgH
MIHYSVHQGNPRFTAQGHPAIPAPSETLWTPVVRRAVVSTVGVLLMLGAFAATLHAQPAAKAAPARPVGDSTPAARTPRSWTADRRDYVVGDIITVLIDEYTLASANKDNTAIDNKRRVMDVGASLPASEGAASTNPSASINSSNNGQRDQHGNASRGNRFVGEMSVRVTAITKEGNLQLKGVKTVDVDKNKQQLTLSGFVRPRDISTRDIVESSRIADAQITYTAKGSLGKAGGGLLTRILGVFWP